MQRLALQAAVLRREGLYQFISLTPQQARAWLDEGEDPLYQSAPVGSVLGALSERQVSPRVRGASGLRSTRATRRSSSKSVKPPDPLGRANPPCTLYRRANFPWRRSATTSGSGSCGKLRRDGYVQSITMWDPAYRPGYDRTRYLAQEALLTSFGTYEFSRYDSAKAREWAVEGPFTSRLRYDGTCKALESLLYLDAEPSLWVPESSAGLSLRPGDQALIAYFRYPGEQKPHRFEPYTTALDPAYIREHTSFSMLARLSDEFMETHADLFPGASPSPEALQARQFALV
jgi:hypothetical protein